MQVTIAATSSRLDNDTVLIEVTTTIGDSVSTQRCGYSVFELEQNRYMAGTLEERIEKLRQSAQDAAEHSFKAQYAALLAYQAGTPPAVLEGANTVLEVVKETTEEPAKKTRAKRTTKPATEATEQE
ncbi:hypothetical protein SHL_00016 [Pseudomonas phage shl2]|uniref:Uncharacterized protein n=2 Tax=Viruses TaxID=10239 RepID=A0A160SWK1_9CAUD|nr:hypothetical protein HOV57_gp16 [Pseudomonas phage shl2]UAV89366.1 hypothetical protein FMS_12 [Pseudomonas phage FMS]CUR50706.1 hypothetical protein SHL_00016 [Pseudomonas phage shl2]